MSSPRRFMISLLSAALLAAPVHAQRFSTTELQFQYGDPTAPEFAGGGDDWTAIGTITERSR